MPEHPADDAAAVDYPQEGISVPDDDISRARQRLGSLLRQSRRSIEPPLSQKDVAQQLGLAQSAVSDWERGASWPTVFSLLAVVRLLGINPAGLLEVLEEPNGEGRAA